LKKQEETEDFGSAVLELLADKNIKVNLIRLGTPDEFVEQGSREELLRLIGLDKDGIKRAIYKILLD
jgi:1-deoxy-D-xylulose-5-phosphate synthase